MVQKKTIAKAKTALNIIANKTPTKPSKAKLDKASKLAPQIKEKMKKIVAKKPAVIKAKAVTKDQQKVTKRGSKAILSPRKIIKDESDDDDEVINDKAGIELKSDSNESEEFGTDDDEDATSDESNFIQKEALEDNEVEGDEDEDEDENDDGDDDEDEDEGDDDDDEDEDETEEHAGSNIEPGEVIGHKINCTSDDEYENGIVKTQAKKEINPEDDDDSDDAPQEAAISKIAPKDDEINKLKTKKKGGIPKITTGKIPNDVPNEQIVFVSSLPKHYKFIDLIEVFVKFGAINIIDRLINKQHHNTILIAYEKTEAADAAIAAAAREEVKLYDKNLKVVHNRPKPDLKERDTRTIIVSCIGRNISVDDLREHFGSCGDIEDITITKYNCPYSFVRFANPETIKEALKLNDSVLKDRILTVRAKNHIIEKDGDRTIVLINTGDSEFYSTLNIKKIFKKFGEIEDIEVLCTKSTLAFITFKTKESAKDAFQLNGKIVNNLEIKLEPYESASNRTVLITNLIQGVTEEQIQEIFAKSGEIEHITLYPGRALIKYKTVDGFCKSFLLNETPINGRAVFVEPNSKLKHKLLLRKRSLIPQNRFNNSHNNRFNNKRQQQHQNGQVTNFVGKKNKKRQANDNNAANANKRAKPNV